jgi:hypothetical protein
MRMVIEELKLIWKYNKYTSHSLWGRNRSDSYRANYMISMIVMHMTRL